MLGRLCFKYVGTRMTQIKWMNTDSSIHLNLCDMCSTAFTLCISFASSLRGLCVKLY